MNSFAVIFDFDGVVVDSIENHRKAVKTFCKKYDIKFTTELFNCHICGKRNEEWIKYIFGLLDKQVSPTDIQKYSNEKERIFLDKCRKLINPIKGVETFLQSLIKNHISYTIASSAPKSNIAFILHKLGYNKYFKKKFLYDNSIQQGKPHPEIYQKAAQILKFPTQKCVVFEDAVSGIEAAKHAGCKVIALETTLSKKELNKLMPNKLKPDAIYKDFTKIDIEILDRLVFNSI